MKIAAHTAEKFSKNPPDHIRVCLFYGPDSGLVEARFKQASLAIVPDLKDPFCVTELSAERLKDDPASLFDEAGAQSLTGGRRIVRIKEVTDTHHKPIESFCLSPVGEALILLSAGDLGPRARLRRLIEQQDNAAAIPCYLDDATHIAQLIAENLTAKGITLSKAAEEYLLNNLGANRGVSLMELEKLALYAAKTGHLAYAECVTLIGDSGAMMIGPVLDAVCLGDAMALERHLPRALAAGNQPIAILRSLSSHLLRLHLVLGLIHQGQSEQIALKSLKPPVFFKQAAAFRQQIRLWRPALLADMLGVVLQTEQACKQTGSDAVMLVSRCLHQIAANARHIAKQAKGRPSPA